jgi:hypothetical protein
MHAENFKYKITHGRWALMICLWRVFQETEESFGTG